MSFESRGETIRNMTKALIPLASIDVEHLRDKPNDWPLWGSNDTTLTVGDVRRARRCIGEALYRHEKLVEDLPISWDRVKP